MLISFSYLTRWNKVTIYIYIYYNVCFFIITIPVVVYFLNLRLTSVHNAYSVIIILKQYHTYFFNVIMQRIFFLKICLGIFLCFQLFCLYALLVLFYFGFFFLDFSNIFHDSLCLSLNKKAAKKEKKKKRDTAMVSGPPEQHID